MPPSQTLRSRARRRPFVLLLALCGLALPALCLARLAGATRAAATFVVTNVNDLGPGSLREAINEANLNPGPDTITFAIGSGPQTIRPLSRLPALTGPVVIDGTTQPGFGGAPIIELDGASQFDGSGLLITGGDSTVRGLVINSFRFDGIVISGKGGNRVEGCYIGVDMSGAIARPNNGHGVSASVSDNRIGGTTPGARNVISGNAGNGVNISRFCCTGNETPITGNVVQGNYVGTNAAGTAAIPNGAEGVFITSVNSNVPVTGNVIGGAEALARNVISGNSSHGVVLDGFHVSNNTVQGNYVGTDATGNFAVPNTGDGISVNGSSNLIGGPAPGAGNVVSGNVFRQGTGGGGLGVGVGGTGNVVQGNIIGANASLTAPIPNTSEGIGAGGTNLRIGGAAPGEANVVAFNGFGGISNRNLSSTGSSYRGNSIFSNEGLGIDLGNTGVNPNDVGDADAGANNSQNFPVITSFSAGAGAVNVKGTLNSTANTTFNLDFYANSACDPSGFGEGARRVGSGQVTTDSGGNAAFDFNFGVSLPAGQVLTATATDPSGNTSEFSQCDAAAASRGSVSFAPAPALVSEGAGLVSLVLNRTGGSAGPLTVNFATFGDRATPGSDFTPTQGTFTFADGETSKMFTLPILDDSLDELAETLKIRLSVDDAAHLDTLGSPSVVTLTIVDNDPAPAVSIADLSASEGDTGTTNFDFTVSLSAVSARTVTVDFNTSNGTAVGGGNDFFLPAVTTVTIPAGQTSAKITIQVRGDVEIEPDETFFVNLLSATAAFIGDEQAQGVILNDDTEPRITLSINDVSVTEGDGGATNAVFNATLSAATDKTVTVDVITIGDAATPNVDFTPVFLTLTFAPGETTKTVNVPILGDTLFEGNETFRVEFRNAVNVVVADDSGLGVIIDNEQRPRISVGDVTVTEGDGGTTNAVFTITLSGPSARPVGFQFQTSNGTAEDLQDFMGVGGGANFGPGVTTLSISVPVLGDTITEGDEVFFLAVTNPVDAGLGDSQGAATIKDDESAAEPPTLQFTSRERVTSEAIGRIEIGVTRSGDASAPATVNYATRSSLGSAQASDRTDYTPIFGTLRFAAGQIGTFFTIPINDDSFQEGDEFFTVVLSDPTGAALGEPNVCVVRILDRFLVPPFNNPIDFTPNFVRQHYHDFFSRVPDSDGLAHWTNVIESCGADAQCREVRRINVSGAFFLSIEFKETGYLVERAYKAAYGDATGASTLGGAPHTLTVPIVRLEEFLPDTQRIGQGVVVLQGDWQGQLEANKRAYFLEFVQRQRFIDAFPLSMTPTDFVDRLNGRAGGPLDASERQNLINELTANNTTAGRASVLRKVAEDPTLEAAEINRAFVLMQYFGYLRRDPNEGRDTDYTGYEFWLGNLERFNGNFVQAELVKAFISSTEYRQRFGQ